MSDYQRTQSANRWANKYGKWFVYGLVFGFLPAAIVIRYLVEMAPILHFAITGILQ